MKLSARELACKHYKRVTLGIDISPANSGDNSPTSEGIEIYTAAMLICAAADGVLHEKEEQWIIGHQAAFGASDSVLDKLDELKTKWTYEDILAKIKESPRLKFLKRSFVFHCLSASAADGDLDPAEVESVRGVSSALELPPDQFEELLGIFKKQQEVNDQLTGCLWKDGNPYK